MGFVEKYILCKTKQAKAFYDDMVVNPERYLNLTTGDLENLNLEFVIDLPTDCCDIILTKTIQKDILAYDSIDNLLEDFVFTYQLGEEYDDEDIEKNYRILQNEFLVMCRTDNQLFNLISLEEIEYVYEDIFSGLTEFMDDNMTMGLNMDNYDNIFDQFISILESIITNDYAYVSCLSENSDSGYNLCIFKESGYLSEKLTDIKAETKNGLCYEHGISDLRDYIGMSLLINRSVAVSVSVHASDAGTPAKDSFFKKYGIAIIPDNCRINLVQLSAKQVMEVFNYNHENISKCQDIYCGSDKNDIIYGLNL